MRLCRFDVLHFSSFFKKGTTPPAPQNTHRKRPLPASDQQQQQQQKQQKDAGDALPKKTRIGEKLEEEATKRDDHEQKQQQQQQQKQQKDDEPELFSDSEGTVATAPAAEGAAGVASMENVAQKISRKSPATKASVTGAAATTPEAAGEPAAPAAAPAAAPREEGGSAEDSISG